MLQMPLSNNRESYPPSMSDFELFLQ